MSGADQEMRKDGDEMNKEKKAQQKINKFLTTYRNYIVMRPLPRDNKEFEDTKGADRNR